MTDISNYMDAVAEVARIAGDIANAYYGKNPDIHTKADGSPVTVADLAAEQAARAWIEQRFPDDGILGEELPPVRPDAARRWIVDPIDGVLKPLKCGDKPALRCRLEVDRDEREVQGGLRPALPRTKIRKVCL